DGIRDFHVTGVQTCALPILNRYGQIETSAPMQQGERPLSLANGQPNISGDWAPVQMLLTDPRVGGIPREEQPASARGPGGGPRRAEERRVGKEPCGRGASGW